MKSFGSLGLSEKTLEVLTQMGFENPTPIQAQAIPSLLENNPTDFIGLAQTGTGKTAAFGLPLLELIDPQDRVAQALIMAPTRELGQQIAEQLNAFANNRKDISVAVVYGGASIDNQIKALKKRPQIIVATPGRLLDLIRRSAVNLETVDYVVLDEADEMLNMGFKEDIDSILSNTPPDRTTWLFSATMPNEIRRIVEKFMKEPIEVKVNTENKVNVDIEHQYVVTKTANKFEGIRRFLDLLPEMRGVLFCRTKRETQQIADQLDKLGYSVEALHGDLSQAQRDIVMRRFKTRAMQLLIATDVAARGIDVNDLTHVIHHTLPDQVESYTHRSGRTGRAGKKGISLAFINPREARKIDEIERKVKVKFNLVQVPQGDAIRYSRINHWADLILNTEIDEQAQDILEHLHGQFAHLSKEDLLKRLITTQLDHLLATQQGNDEDLNEKQGSRKKDRGEAEKAENTFRFFINVGTIDGVTKGDLVHFVADIARINRRSISDLSIQKNHAYFSVEKVDANGLSDKFKGIEVEGRAIRVQREEEKRKHSKAAFTKPSNSSKRPKARSSKPKNDKFKKRNGRKDRRRGRR